MNLISIGFIIRIITLILNYKLKNFIMHVYLIVTDMHRRRFYLKLKVCDVGKVVVS